MRRLLFIITLLLGSVFYAQAQAPVTSVRVRVDTLRPYRLGYVLVDDTMRVNGLLAPHATTTHDLGSPDLRWRSGYYRSLIADSAWSDVGSFVLNDSVTGILHLSLSGNLDMNSNDIVDVDAFTASGLGTFGSLSVTGDATVGGRIYVDSISNPLTALVVPDSLTVTGIGTFGGAGSFGGQLTVVEDGGGTATGIFRELTTGENHVAVENEYGGIYFGVTNVGLRFLGSLKGESEGYAFKHLLMTFDSTNGDATVSQALNVTDSAVVSGDVIIGAGNAAKIQLTTTNATGVAGEDALYRWSGRPVLSSAGSMWFLQDNDNNTTTGAFQWVADTVEPMPFATYSDKRLMSLLEDGTLTLGPTPRVGTGGVFADTLNATAVVTVGTATSPNIILGVGATAKMTIFGANATLDAGTNQIAEITGPLALSGASSIDNFLDNDASQTNASWDVYTDTTGRLVSTTYSASRILLLSDDGNLYVGPGATEGYPGTGAIYAGSYYVGSTIGYPPSAYGSKTASGLYVAASSGGAVTTQLNYANVTINGTTYKILIADP